MKRLTVVFLMAFWLVSCAGTNVTDSDDPCIQEAQATNAENRKNVKELAKVYKKSVGDMNDAFDETFKRMIERCEVKAKKRSSEKESESE